MVALTKLADEDAAELPPAYTHSDSSSTHHDAAAATPPPPPPPAESSSSSTAPPHTRLTNFLSIFHANHSIKGSYTIDPSLPPPPSVAPPQDTDGRPLNLRLGTQNGAIDATISLVNAHAHAHDAKGPALLDASSLNGSVSLKITTEPLHQQHFHLRAASQNGAITLRLPSTFTGPISTRLKNGRLIFSPPVQAQLTTFSEDGLESSFFIGDYIASGYTTDSAWPGDALRVEALNGRVKISWVDEQEDERKGFFARFF